MKRMNSTPTGAVALCAVFLLSTTPSCSQIPGDDENVSAAQQTGQSSAALSPAAASNPGLDLYDQIKDPLQRLFYRVAAARPDGNDTVYYWKGLVYLDIPGDVHAAPYPGAPGKYYPHGGGNSGTPLVGFEGYSIRRILPHPTVSTDFILSTREISFYTDVKTGAILTEWKNPLTGKTTPVFPVVNEHLPYRYRVDQGVLKPIFNVDYSGPGGCQRMELAPDLEPPEQWGTDYTWHMDAFPRYRLNDCGRYGITDTMGLKNGKYTSSEMIDYFAPRDAADILQLETTVASPFLRAAFKHWMPKMNAGWARVGPALPWMCMSSDQFQGRVIYHARVEQVASWDGLPVSFKNKINAYPFSFPGLTLADWKQAPAAYVPDRPGDTTWSAFHAKVLVPAGKTWQQWCDSFPAP